jgi:glycosyltransferase involved in cell wall biosynthesis
LKIAIDASPLVINQFSGLAEVIHNLITHLPFVNDDKLILYLNYFRPVKNKIDISYSNVNTYFLKLPRKSIEWWWKHDWPPIDYFLKDSQIFHSLHIQLPPPKKIKTILTVHDCRRLALPELYSKKDVEIYKQQMKLSLNRVDFVITVSEFTKLEVLKYFSFDPDRIKVIPNGFTKYTQDTCIEHENLKCVISKKEIPRAYFLHIGSLEPRKNLKRLIQAMALCQQGNLDFPNLVIAGINKKQWLKSKEAALAKNLNLTNTIFLSGVVKKNILKTLIKNSVALCYPSLYEGFGFPPLEAMSLGIPVLAGEVSAIPETVAQAACLIDPTSAEDIAQGLQRLVFNNCYREFLIRLGHSQVDKFSWDKTAKDYFDLYKKVLAT